LKLVFLGPPGAGKGTQASRVAEQFGLEHASTGSIFREAVAQGSPLGGEVKAYLDAGKLVPDELTSRVVREMVLERLDSYIMDGYPRTLAQAEALDEMLKGRGEDLDAVLSFELDEKTAIERLTGRLTCKKCGENYHKVFMPPKKEGVCDECGGQLIVRSDSTPEAVRERMAQYDEKTQPLAAYYEKRGLLRTVDASEPPDNVTQATRGLLRSLAER
jgi:adenylate kinase